MAVFRADCEMDAVSAAGGGPSLALEVDLHAGKGGGAKIRSFAKVNET